MSSKKRSRDDSHECECGKSSCMECSDADFEPRASKTHKTSKSADVSDGVLSTQQSLRAQLEQTQAELEQARQKLTETKQQLMFTKKDLKKTKTKLEEEKERHEDAHQHWEEAVGDLDDMRGDLEKLKKVMPSIECNVCFDDDVKLQDVLTCRECGEHLCITCYNNTLGIKNLEFDFNRGLHPLAQFLTATVNNVNCINCQAAHCPFDWQGSKIFDVPSLGELKRNNIDTSVATTDCSCFPAVRGNLEERLQHRLMCVDMLKFRCPFEDCDQEIPITAQPLGPLPLLNNVDRIKSALYEHITGFCKHEIDCKGCCARQHPKEPCPSGRGGCDRKVVELRHLSAHLLEDQRLGDYLMNIWTLGLQAIAGGEETKALLSGSINMDRPIGEILAENSKKPAFKLTVDEYIKKISTDKKRSNTLQNRAIIPAGLFPYKQVKFLPQYNQPAPRQDRQEPARASRRSEGSRLGPGPAPAQANNNRDALSSMSVLGPLLTPVEQRAFAGLQQQPAPAQANSNAQAPESQLGAAVGRLEAAFDAFFGPAPDSSARMRE